MPLGEDAPSSPGSSRGHTQIMRRVAVLGGSFDPITDAHLKMAAEVIHMNAADEVWLVPCGARPDKESLRTSTMERYIMCHLAVNTAFSRDFPILVKGEELFATQALKTFELMELMAAKYGQECTISFVVGSDLIEEIPRWGGPKGWYLNRDFIVIPRPGYPVPSTGWVRSRRVCILDAVIADKTHIVGSNISSSEIRRRIVFARGSVRELLGAIAYKAEGLIPHAVLMHIAKYQLLLGDAESRSSSTEAATHGNLGQHKLNVGSRLLELEVSQVTAGQGKRRVAIFGGSFDPITDGHLKMAAEVIHAGAADFVWIVPCGPRPDKPSLRTNAIDRLVMFHIAVNTVFSADFPVSVHGTEVLLERALTTPQLLERLELEYKDQYEFVFMAGTDLLPGIPEWDRSYGDWYKKRDFVVIPRPGYDLPSEWKHRSNVQILQSPIPRGDLISSNLSSSEVRNRISLTQSISRAMSLSSTKHPLGPETMDHTANEFEMRCVEGLVPVAVINHMHRYRLYMVSARRLSFEIQ